jgi:L,D-transpeptidase-like protein
MAIGGYPPPAYYRANPSPPVQGADRDEDAEAYDDEYDGYYPPRPRFGDVPNGSSSAPLGAPFSPRDHGTAVATLPPDYQPEQGPTKEIPPQFRRTVVDYRTAEPSGTIVIDTPSRYLYLTLGNGEAIRYGVGVGREGFTWSGTERISRIKEWPDWVPPKEMIARQPYLPRFMAGGETNPLGARAPLLLIGLPLLTAPKGKASPQPAQGNVARSPGPVEAQNELSLLRFPPTLPFPI